MGNEKTGLEFMLDLYEATSQYNRFREVCLPEELYPYAEQLFRFYDQPLNLINLSGKLIPIMNSPVEKAVFSFSGGKDSLATFLRHRKEFKKVSCVYVKKATPYLENTELERAENLARKVGVSLTEIDLKMSSKLSLPESVIKNQVIYALIMEKMEELPQAVGFGGTREIGPQSMAFFHDSSTSFEIFHEFAKAAWGNHMILPFLKNELESYRVIYEEDPSLIPNLSSCMTSPKDKEKIRKLSEERFQLKLENEYQCGSCYKCAEEQIIANMFYGRVLPLNYINFCKATLVEKCVFEIHNKNGLVPRIYLSNLGIKSVVDLVS